MQRCSEATAVVAQSCGSAVLLSCVSGVRTLGRLRLQQPSCLMGGRSISSAILLVISAPTALRYFAASTQARKPVASANVEPCGRLMFRELSRMWMGTRALVVFSESTLHRARLVLSHSCHLWPGIQCGAGCSSSVPGGSSERGGLEEPLAPLGVVLQKNSLHPPLLLHPVPRTILRSDGHRSDEEFCDATIALESHYGNAPKSGSRRSRRCLADVP